MQSVNRVISPLGVTRLIDFWAVNQRLPSGPATRSDGAPIAPLPNWVISPLGVTRSIAMWPLLLANQTLPSRAATGAPIAAGAAPNEVTVPAGVTRLIRPPGSPLPLGRLKTWVNQTLPSAPAARPPRPSGGFRSVGN